MKQSRKRNGMSVWAAAAVLAVLSVVAAAWWLLAHVLVALGFTVLLAVTYCAGRHNRPRVGQLRRAATTIPGKAERTTQQ